MKTLKEVFLKEGVPDEVVKKELKEYYEGLRYRADSILKGLESMISRTVDNLFFMTLYCRAKKSSANL
jgi:hypothetical protein